MDNSTKLRSIIIGLEILGGKFVKIESDSIHFDAPKESKIHNDENIEKAKKLVLEMMGIDLIISKIK